MKKLGVVILLILAFVGCMKKAVIEQKPKPINLAITFDECRVYDSLIRCDLIISCDGVKQDTVDIIIKTK